MRLEVAADAPEPVVGILSSELGLEPDDVYVAPGLLDLRALAQIHALPRPDLKEAPFLPQTQHALAVRGEDAPDLFARLRERAVLVHHPYDSFATSVQVFLEQAAADPNVLAIKHTLYRTAQALALIEGRTYVVPDDVKELAGPVLAHRVVCRGLLREGQRERAAGIIRQVVDQTAVPS